jgi:ectoine hydroxylase-related dioxygenase (phytanoyl-CoA dioxygenase family)
MIVTATETMPRLTRTEVDRFYADGYVGPFAVCPPEEMLARHAAINQIIATPGIWDKHPEQLRHQDSRLVYELCTHPEVVGRLSSLLGPDLMLWRSNFFTKQAGGKEIPWHQDVNYWRLDPPLNFTVWMAIDEVTAENSCMQVIPGSHTKVVRHVKSTQEMGFDEMAEDSAVDRKKSIDLVMRPGEFVIFNERLLHHSEANRSNKRRMALISRITLPFVKVPPLMPAHKMLLLCGQDRFGINDFAPPPVG